MASSLAKKRFPRILSNELLSALRALDDLDPDTQAELLARHRRNSEKRMNAYIREFGMFIPANPPRLVVGMEDIPLRWMYAIARLDEAYQKLHNYLDGDGAADYVAAAVQRIINTENAKKPRSRSSKATDLVELKESLVMGGYLRTTDKARRSAIKQHVAITMKISVATVNRNIHLIQWDS